MHLVPCIAITYSQNKRARYVRVLVALSGLTAIHDRIKHIKKVLSVHDYNTDEVMVVVEADASYPVLVKLTEAIVTVPLDDGVQSAPFAPLIVDQGFGFEQSA